MNLDSRLNKLEAAIGDAWDLTLLTDAELIALERVLAGSLGERVCLTPELEAAIHRLQANGRSTARL
jgi:hypothetical protein